MLVQNFHIEAIEKLLASITLTMGEDGFKHSFLYKRPDSILGQRFYTELFYHPVELGLVALHVRSVGPSYLRALPLDEIRSELMNFISEKYWRIGNITFSSGKDERPLNQWIPDYVKLILAEALATSTIFVPITKITVFPLVPVVVEKNFTSDKFFFFITS